MELKGKLQIFWVTVLQRESAFRVRNIYIITYSRKSADLQKYAITE